ncbi:hypothetical protein METBISCDRAFT_13377 [Metschnikowia bicuspidata]|uniref:Zn(2)-C6 fungal-type domain-containing protein n=1 Tax=Metschnikowia bicuspidata TaxID=27322 RepID=A0A4V1J3E4_9ASCO|nr:hypothetical protein METBISCDRAFT_13377 [Metschnikowia bicuspidata]
MGRVSFLESDSGQDKDALQPDQDDKQEQQKCPQSACVRCRFRHTRCPGGMPCSKCQMAKTNCEYVMHEKRLVVSRKYIYKLQDDISRLKKENAALRTSLRDEQAKKHHPSDPTPHATIAQLADTQVQPHIDVLGRTEVLPPAEDTEVIRPSLDKHGRLIQSRTGEKVYVGSSSMTFFGLEIQNMAPALPSSKLLNPNSRVSSPSDSPGSQASFSHLGFDSHRKRETRILEKEGNAYNITLAKTNTRPELSVNFTLPSYSYSILLVDTFINYHDGCFYFFNEGLVKRFLVNLYSGNTVENKKIIKRNIIPNAGPADAENTIKKDTDDDTILETIWFCKILLIFAIGEMYLGTESDTHHKNYENKTVMTYACKSNKKREEAKKNTLPGSGFFYQASKLFTRLFASGAINTTTKDGGIEVMLLYAFYLQVADCTIASYFYFGLALRSALILGWHVDADMENQNRFELEHRRRIWWTVYMYERMLSSKAGLPLSFADDSVSTELPYDFSVDLMDFPRDESDVRGYYVFPSSEYIINCVKITQINAVILSSLYTKQPTANILPVVSDLVQRLFRWKNALLEFLRVDFSGEEVKTSRLVVNLFTEYFQGMNLAVRPLLFHFAAKKLKDLQSQGHINQYIDLSIYSKNVLLLLNASLQASINTIKCIWALLPQNMVALFGWMDREYLFTSASTLILFNASFGVHDATRVHLDHALTIFTRMKKLGNYPAALRRAQLLKLIEMLDFNGVKSDLPSKHDEATKAAPGERNAAQPENALPLNPPHGAASFQPSEPVFSGTTVAPEPFRSDLNFLQFNNAVPSATGPSSSHHTPLISPAISEMMGAHTGRCKHALHSDFFSNEDWAGIEGFTYPDEELKLWNEITNDAVWLQPSGVPGTLHAGEEPVPGHDQSSFKPFPNLAGAYIDLISLEFQNDMFS